MRREKKLFTKMENEKLTVKGNWQLFKVAYIKDKKTIGRFIDFVGYKHYRGFTTIRKSIYKSLRRKAAHFAPTINKSRSLISYYGYIKHSNNNLQIEEFEKARCVLSEKSENARNELS